MKKINQSHDILDKDIILINILFSPPSMMTLMSTPDLNMKQMRQAAGEATAMLRVLANEDRLLLLCQLTQGEACVSELQELLGIHQPTLSQQLGILRSEEIVSTRREGKKIFYQVSDQRVVAVLTTLNGLYCPEPTRASRPARLAS
ncbi:MAG: metalloregulator ArsR/SmtB family transcription factor [Polaromonas sp.]